MFTHEKWGLTPKLIFINEKFKISFTLTQCGNFMIFLYFKFYVKSILRILEVQNLPFNTFRGPEFWFLWIFGLLNAEIYQMDNIQRPKMTKMPFLEVLDSP